MITKEKIKSYEELIKIAYNKIPKEFNKEYYVNYDMMINFGILINDNKIPLELRAFLAEKIINIFPELKYLIIKDLI